MESKPLIVVIEGCDAAGKNTQARLLASRYDNGTFLSFPRYEGPFGEVLRRSLRRESVVYSRVPGQDGEPPTYKYNSEDDIIALRGLFLLDHYDGASEILKLRKEGKLIVLDRYWPSNVCYGAEDGFSMQLLESASSFMPVADIYFFVDVSIEESSQRRPVPRDRYEKDLEKMARVRQRYINLWHKNNGGNTGPLWVTIDGHKTKEDIHEEIFRYVTELQS